MNYRQWMKDSKAILSQTSVGVWGFKKDGTAWGGTGFLLEFRDYRLVCSCSHVLNPIEGLIYLVHNRTGSFQNTPIHRYKKCFPDIDFGFIVLDSIDFLNKKQFISVENIVLDEIPIDYSVFFYGFPSAHPSIQQGFTIDHTSHIVRMSSMTVLSITENKRYNSDIKCSQPTIRWKQKENLNSKSFKPIGKLLDPRGFSGSPVFLSGSHRLIGHVTHFDKYFDNYCFYTPISKSLSNVDKCI